MFLFCSGSTDEINTQTGWGVKNNFVVWLIVNLLPPQINQKLSTVTMFQKSSDWGWHPSLDVDRRQLPHCAYCSYTTGQSVCTQTDVSEFIRSTNLSPFPLSTSSTRLKCGRHRTVMRSVTSPWRSSNIVPSSTQRLRRRSQMMDHVWVRR